MIHYPDFECPDCDGKGRVRHGIRGANDPSTTISTCDLCKGSGELDASAYLDYAMRSINDNRRLMRLSKSQVYRRQARYWIAEAKKARTIVLEREHHGAAHLVNRPSGQMGE